MVCKGIGTTNVVFQPNRRRGTQIFGGVNTDRKDSDDASRTMNAEEKKTYTRECSRTRQKKVMAGRRIRGVGQRKKKKKVKGVNFRRTRLIRSAVALQGR